MFERRDRPRRDPEPAGASDRAFQRQLHRDRRLDGGLIGYRAGLVGDHRELARLTALDGVGNGEDGERTAWRRDDELALDLAAQLGEARAADRFLGGEPTRD